MSSLLKLKLYLCYHMTQQYCSYVLIPNITVSVEDLVVVVFFEFSSPVLHSVMAKYSLGGSLTGLLVTVVTRTSFKALVTLGSGILLTEVFPTIVTSVLLSSG